MTKYGRTVTPLSDGLVVTASVEVTFMRKGDISVRRKLNGISEEGSHPGTVTARDYAKTVDRVDVRWGGGLLGSGYLQEEDGAPIGFCGRLKPPPIT
jgi:hypothetical protein